MEIQLIDETKEGQINLFPEASKQDIIEAKNKLRKYKKTKRLRDELEASEEPLTENEILALKESKRVMSEIERAVNIIIDPDVREVVTYRFIEGHSHKLTVLNFQSKMDDRTVDRKLIKGIESVAETLLLCKGRI